MKRFIIYIGILFSLFACNQNSPSPASGDLLFSVGAGSAMQGAITAATGRERTLNFTHVGIFVAAHGADSVLEATSDGGVRMTPLADFLGHSAKIGGRPVVVAMRLRDTTGTAAALERARRLLGRPYDYSFRPGNDAYYCSELVHVCYLAPDGTPLFPARPMRFRAADGTMPRYWSELFARLGEEIPEGIPGTNPNDMAAEAILEEVGRYF